MNLEQIANRIAVPELAEGSEISVLKELTEKYPYAQVFSILYLKALSNQSDIHFDEELNRHAYRISDRMKLYDLIHESVPSASLVEEEGLTTESVEELAAEYEEVSADKELIPENGVEQQEVEKELIVESVDMAAEKEEQSAGDEIELVYSEDAAAPEPTVIGSIISSIISEIEPVSEERKSIFSEEQEEISATDLPVEHKEENTDMPAEQVAVDKNETAADDSVAETVPEDDQKESEEYDDLDIEIISQVVETVYNENLKKSLPEPEIVEKNISSRENGNEEEKEKVAEQKKSFTSWLKSGNTTDISSPDQQEENELKKGKDIVSQVDKLVDKFIETEPSISRPKKEFYSPTKKAKESISEEKLIYTETLANIFAMQGNFPKAIQAYEQLILTNPEKKIFFAQKIKELKEKINS